MALAVFGALACAPSAKSADLALSAEERAWLEQTKEIRVGLMNDWPPFSFLDFDGSPVGISPEFAAAINRRIGGRLKLVPGPWKKRYEDVKEKRLDALLDLTPRPDREADFNFTTPYLRVPHVIVARKDTPFIADLKALDGKVMALEKGFGNVRRVREGHPAITVKEYNGTREALDAVARGEADAYGGNRAVATYLMASEVMVNLKIHGRLDFPGSVLSVGVRKDWPILQGILEKALADIGSAERQEILNKWVGGDTQAPGTTEREQIALTPKEVEWLRQHPVIRVGDDFSWPPFSFIDDGGKVAGISSSYMEVIGQRLGIKLEPVRGLTWPQVVERAKRREVDLLPAAARTPEREQFLNFTNPYISFPVVLATRKDGRFVDGIGDLKGLKVGVVDGYVTHSIIARDHPNLLLIPTKSLAIGLKELNDGKIDAFADNLASITYEISRGNFDNIRIAAPTEYRFPLSFAIRKDWTELLGAINKALATISEREHAAIKNSWVGIEVKFGWDTRRIVLWSLPAGGMALAIITVFVVWNRRLGREVAERHRAEKHAQERENWFRSLIESAPDAIVIVGDDGVIRRINLQAEKLFGYSRDEIVGEKVEILLPEQMRAHHPRLRKTFTSERGVRPMGSGQALSGQDKSGRIFPVEVNLSPIDSVDGRHIVATVRDVSERRQAEEKMQKSLDELQAFNRLAIDRELRMIELKKEINELNAALDRDTRYEIVE